MSLTNAQYDTIMRSYNRQEFSAKRKQTEHIEEVYQKIPRIKEITDTISSLSLATSKSLILSGGDVQKEMARFKEQIHELRAEKAALLKQHGYPSDYLEIHYTCPDCKDTGFIENERCHCFKKAAIDLLYKQSHLEDILQKENFSTFKLDYYADNVTDSVTNQTPRQNMQKILSEIKKYIDTFGNHSPKVTNLVLFGLTGVGKTFLTHCIAKELIERTFSVIYISAIDFFDILSLAEFKNDEDAKIQEQYFKDCDLLIIDDLGTEINNSFINSVFFNIINERQLANKSIIISSNLNPKEMTGRYSERISSRLFGDYKFLKVVGDDLRRR